jgi:hypothetical protein
MKSYFFLLAIICTCITQSCKTQVTTGKNILGDSLEIIKITTDTNQIFQYKSKGILDSTKVFYKNNKLESIDINNPIDSVISKHYFITGQVKAIFLDREKIKGNIYYYSFFLNGKTEFTESIKDSIIKNKQESSKCSSLLTSYYNNGTIKEIGYQGFYNGTGAAVGDWKEYDSTGILTAITHYHNDKQDKAYIERREYFRNGQLSSIKKYSNDLLYEIEKKNIGTWYFYDSTGKLINKKQY